MVWDSGDQLLDMMSGIGWTSSCAGALIASVMNSGWGRLWVKSTACCWSPSVKIESAWADSV